MMQSNLFRKDYRSNGLAIAAIFFAAIASTSVALGQITYVKTFSSFGSEPGQVIQPTAVAVSATGQVYVADLGNGRIDVFDTNGVYQTSFGTSGGIGGGQLSTPFGVAVSPTNGEVLVTDNNSNIVDVFNSSGVYQNSIGSQGSGAGQYSLPEGIVVNASGQVYVADASNSRIDVFSIYGGYGFSFGSSGSGNGQFSGPPLGGPIGVAVSPTTGNVYAADTANQRIEVFNSSGIYQFSFGSFGAGPGQFSNPWGVAVSATGDVFVADTQNSRIEVFNSSGVYQASFGVPGNGVGQLSNPLGVAVSPTGEIYVASTYNYQIVKYFDPAEWVSGTPHFDNAGVGYGQVLGTSLNMAATLGLQVDGAMTIHPGGSFIQAGNVTVGSYANMIVSGSFTNNGQYTVNGGTVTVGGGMGTLLNNATMTLNGGIVTASLTNNYGASLNAAGTVTGNLTNDGMLTQSGLLSVCGSFTNAGTTTITIGQQLVPTGVVNSGNLNLNGGAITNGGDFTNFGLVALNGGAIVGSGNFNNGASGTIRGDGTITMNVSNQGGLIYANGTYGLTITSFSGNFPGGELRVADGDSLTVWAASANGGSFSNHGTITLQGPNATLNGDAIVNGAFGGGSISGQGRITNAISNLLTITAVGGQLVLAGNVNNYGTGSIQSAAGTSIVVTQGISYNDGLIALTGGSFDNNSNALTNIGSILGNGIFSTGGLWNYGVMTFSDGNSSIFGGVTNNSGGQLTTYGTSPAGTIVTFYGAVTNSAGALIQTNSSTARWLGGLNNNGTYISDPAANYFTGLSVGPSGVLQGGVGDQFFVTGPFTNAGQIDLASNSAMVLQSGGTLTQTSGSLHLGTSATLSAGAVDIKGGTLLADGSAATIAASLVYASSSSSTYEGILTGAGDSLTLDNPDAILVLSGASNSFRSGTYVEAGELELASAGALLEGSSLTVGTNAYSIFGNSLPQTAAPVPEPSTLVLLAVAGIVAAAASWRRRK